MFENFLHDRRGNVAIMFGLIVFALLAAGGVAVDMQRRNTLKAGVQEAADGALIAAARYKATHPNASDSAITAVARKLFDSSMKQNKNVDISSFNIVYDSANSKFVLDLSATTKTVLLGVVGDRFINLDTHSEAKLGKPPIIELSMALDTTGSMGSNGKMPALKSAAKELVETLFDADAANVKIGVVPFAQYVNVGMSHKNDGWLDHPDSGWVGCVGSRDYPYNVEDSDYDTYPAKSVEHGSVECPKELLPLSTNENSIETMINGLAPHGFTYIPAGLKWAWALLTPTAPFTEGMPFTEMADKNATKALIVMTDGENTKAPTYPLHDSSDKTLADQLTEEICANIKKENIVVYSIAFTVTEQHIKDVLEGCATSPSYYFDAADASELTEAFRAIATSVRSISLSK